jgi:hypothetical protein
MFRGAVDKKINGAFAFLARIHFYDIVFPQK